MKSGEWTGFRGLGALLAAVMALGVAAAPGTAAVVNTISDGQTAVSIEGLDVGGVLYTVTWAFDSTYVAPVDASLGMSALLAALNGTTAVFVDVPGVGAIDNFRVVTGSDNIIATSRAFAGNWQVFNSIINPDLRARFEAVVAPIPLPASGLLLVGGLGLGLALARRRRRA